jgi:serine/threonine protein kinase
MGTISTKVPDSALTEKSFAQAVAIPTTGPINNTFLRRTLARLAIKTLSWRPKKDTVRFWTSSICYKQIENLSEPYAMQLVRQNTTVPVPRVLIAWTDKKGKSHLVMERIRGRELGPLWNEYNREEKEAMTSQLKNIVAQYRAIRPLSTAIGSANYSAFDNELFYLSGKGPFKDAADFHFFICGGYVISLPNTAEKLKKFHSSRNFKPVFTHGDLAPRNVLVRDNKIVGVVDWGSSGWYPDYWEYTISWFTNERDPDFRDHRDKFLDAYPYSFEVEQLRWQYCAIWGGPHQIEDEKIEVEPKNGDYQ